MAQLPTGTVTFLFSDMEGSTELTRRLRERWPEAHAAHRRLLREAFAAAGGREVDTQGDAFFAVFARAREALAAAAAAQRALAEHNWPDDARVQVRMGVHTGEPHVGDEGYLGLDVVRGARIAATARGGQVLVSETTRALVRGDDLGGLELRDLGEQRLKDFDEPERLYQLAGPGLRDDFPPPVPSEEAPLAALGVAGRELELASQAMAAFRDLKGLDRLGETIQAQLDETLMAAGIVTPAPGLPPGSRTRANRFAAAIAVAVAAAVGALVILLVWLL